jgi:hypothetical protein
MTLYQRFMIKADTWTRQAILAAAIGDQLGADMNNVRAATWRDRANLFSIEEASQEYPNG